MKYSSDPRTNESERVAVDCDCCTRPLPYHFVNHSAPSRPLRYLCEACRMRCRKPSRYHPKGECLLGVLLDDV